MTQLPLGQSSRVSQSQERYGYLLQGKHNLYAVVERNRGKDPFTYDQAMMDADSARWQDAMRIEMDSMLSNQVWTLVDCLKGMVPIRCKWIYKRKTSPDGKVNIYKARLVVKGIVKNMVLIIRKPLHW